MAARFLRGDLFHYDGLTALAHGCNCAGAMGKGIAVEFRARFPKMYAEYKKRCTDGRFTLGDVFLWTENEWTIFNLGTQRSWKTKAEITAVETAVREMLRLAEAMTLPRIGLPRIGAGLGALPWPKVRSLLEAVGGETSVELLVFEEFEPVSAPR